MREDACTSEQQCFSHIQIRANFNIGLFIVFVLKVNNNEKGEDAEHSLDEDFGL